MKFTPEQIYILIQIVTDTRRVAIRQNDKWLIVTLDSILIELTGADR